MIHIKKTEKGVEALIDPSIPDIEITCYMNNGETIKMAEPKR